MSGLVDTHAHLDDDRLAADLPGVLARAREAGVAQIIAIGTTAESSAAVLQIAQNHPGVFAAVGIQPNHVAESKPGEWESVMELARQPKVVALGETGLDRYWDYTPFDQQQAAFDRHLALSQESGLPVVIHCRNCEADIVRQLENLGRQVRGVLHSFTGTWDDVQAFVALGLHISFAGMVTFEGKKNDPLRQVAAQVPLDRLLVETDSPYLSPHPFRGKMNEPARVAVTATCIARVRGMNFGDLISATTANARGLFGLAATETV